MKPKAVFPIFISTVLIIVLLLTPLATLSRSLATPSAGFNNYLPYIQADGTAPATPTPTATPIGPYLVVTPSCWTPGSPNSTVELSGGNWPTSPAPQSPINLSVYDGLGNSTPIAIIPQGHGGSFNGIFFNVAAFTVDNAPYTFAAAAINGAYAEFLFSVPCPIDLIISSQPTLVSTPPIVAYEPVTFSYLITNTGSADITELFFVDTFFNPTGVTSTTIPISYSVGYNAIVNLLAGESRVITLTVPTGFTTGSTSHLVLGMVDSLYQIQETDETNNITNPLVVPVTPQPSPTPPAAPPGSSTIAGIVRILNNATWTPVYRADVYLIQTSGVPTPTIVGQTISLGNGAYAFNHASLGVTYTVLACFTVIGPNGILHYVAVRPGITSPNFFVDLFMTINAQGCPVP